MPVTFVGVGAAAAASGAGPITPALPVGFAAADVLFLHAYSFTAGTISTPTGWVALTSGNTTGGGTGALFRRVAQAGDTNPSFTGPGGGLYGVTSAYRGAATPTPEDVTSPAATSGSGTTVTAPSVTTVTDAAMVVWFHAQGDNNALDTPTNTATLAYGGSSYSATLGGDACLGSAYKTIPTAGASGTCALTATGGQPNTQWVGLTVALRPVSTAAPVTVTDTPQGSGAGIPQHTLTAAFDPNVTSTDSPNGASAGTPRDVLAIGVTRLDRAGSGGAGNPPSARLIDQAALPSSGELAVLWWAIHPVTGARIALPDVVSWSLSPIFNSPGAVSLSYPAHGLNFATLDAFVTERRDLEVEVWFRGRVQGALRGLLCEKSGDLVEAGATWSFGGHFLEHLMSQILVTPYEPDPKKETVFSAVSPGTVMATLMQRAHARGTATDVGITSFSTTVDSNGVAWNRTVTATLSPVNTTYLQVLDDLVEQGACEWEVTPDHQLRLYVAGTRGIDRTVGANPVVLRRGRNLTDVPSKVSSREGGTDLWGVGGEGLYHLEFDATARATRGRQVERAFSANGVADAGALDALTTARLPGVTGGVREVTHGILFGANDPLPLTGFNIGDWVYSNPGKGSSGAGGGNERLRLKQWSLSRDAARKYTGTITLNDLYAEQLVQLQRRLAALQGGQLVVGTSTPGSSGPDLLAPAAPTGLVASSIAYQDDNHSQTLAAVSVAWSAVITNSDGTAADDVAGYKVYFAYLGLSQVGGIPSSNPVDEVISYTEVTPSTGIPGTSLTFGGVEGGANIGIKVLAFDQSGNQSAFSAVLGHTASNDNTPPPVPSAPTARNFLRQLIVEWDGLGSAGEVMPRDFDFTEVHASLASNFTVTAATQFERVYGRGGVVYDPGSYGGTVFFRLRSVDRAGNRSVASVQASATPTRAIADDIGDQIIGAAKLADGAVLGPKIGSEQISTPHLTVATFSDNLIPNGGFDDLPITGTYPVGSWFPDVTTGGVLTRDTTAVNVTSGSASLKFALTAASGKLSTMSETIPTAAGDNWFFETNVKGSRAAGAGFALWVSYHATETGGALGFVIPVPNGALTTGFVSKEANLAVPATIGGSAPKFLRAYLIAGEVVGDGAALDVWVDHLRARKVVGTAEIQDAAISRAKIGLLAVGDAQIETASIGKLTSGTMTATVTNSGLFRTAITGNRVEFDSAGIRLFMGSTVVGRWQTSDASMLMTGTYQSALSGARINIFPDGTLRFYPSSGTNYSQIANFGNDIVWRGPTDVNGRSGRVNVNVLGVGINFSNEADVPNNLRAEVAVFDRKARITSPLLDIEIDGKFSPPDGTFRRVAFSQTNSSGVRIASSVLEYKLDTSSNAGMVAIGGDAGWKAEAGSMLVVNAAMTAFVASKASAFVVSSTEAGKDQIADIRALIDPLAVIGAVRAKRYIREADKWVRPTPTVDDPDPAPVPNPDPPVSVGVIAEELPAALQVTSPAADGTGPELSVDLAKQYAVLWGALNQIADQRIVHTAASVTPPAMTVSNTDTDVTVAWLGGPTQTVPALVSIVPVGPGPLQQRAITASVVSMTTTGVTVRFRSKRALTGGTALDPDDRYVVNAVYSFIPPYLP